MDRQTWLDAEHDAKKSETKGKMEHVLAMDGLHPGGGGVTRHSGGVTRPQWQTLMR
jgi:hypothetical protein